MSEEMDFSTVIASAVHDMKNSLGMLLNSLDELRGELPAEQHSGRFNTLEYEAQRVHSDLIQLLGLYRIQQQSLSAHAGEHFVPEFLDEQLAQHQVLMSARGITLEVEAAAVTGYFDGDLIAGVLNNILNNAIRYTQSAIRVSAREQAGYLIIAIEDDGEGYPEHMRQSTEQDSPDLPHKGIDFSSGSTNLGIYFAARIARLHQEGRRQGEIRLSNDGELGGGRFEIWLP